MRARNPRIGPRTVLEWSKRLPAGTAILDLGCGYGVPISEALIEAGFEVYGVDASPRLIAAFRERFPNARVECSAAEDSEFFHRTFDAVVAWGLMFLLSADVQVKIIAKVAKALNPGGNFLFTSPREIVSWNDSLTGQPSVALGAEVYKRVLRKEGLVLDGEADDEGDNHYYFASKPKVWD